MLVDLDLRDEVGLIFSRSSGVIFHVQTGGYACHHPKWRASMCLWAVICRLM